MWPWRIYLAPKWPLRRKSRFFAIFGLYLWENRSRYRNNFNAQVLGNQVGLWAFQIHQNEPPCNSTSFPHLELENVKTRKSEYPFSNDKTLLSKLAYRAYQRFQWSPRCGAMFQALSLRNGCIDLHVLYTVGKLILLIWLTKFFNQNTFLIFTAFSMFNLTVQLAPLTSSICNVLQFVHVSK